MLPPHDIQGLAAAEWFHHAMLGGDELDMLTSGTTGPPKQVVLPMPAVLAAVSASQQAVGTGNWLLTLPLNHIAGWMVVARAVVAGGTLACVPAATRFTGEGFVAAAHQLPEGKPWYTSLVPTQLARVLAHPEAKAVARQAKAVLVGGAALSEPLMAAARKAHITIVRTYGMTETCGGCVYDGIALPGVSLRLGEDGRIWVAGPMVASGYRQDPRATAGAFAQADGQWWHRTPDVGAMVGSQLVVLGRADDVIITGGEKVHPGVVEKVINAIAGVHRSVVLGVPHPEWGEQVVALVQLEPGGEHPSEVLAVAEQRCRKALPRYAVPQRFGCGTVPCTDFGKLNRSMATMAWQTHMPCDGQSLEDDLGALPRSGGES